MDKMQALAHFSPANKLDQVQSMKILKLETIFKDLVSEIHGMIPCEKAMDQAVMDLLAVKFKLVHAITHTKQQKPKESEASNGKEKSSKKSDKKSNENLQVIKEEISNEDEI